MTEPTPHSRLREICDAAVERAFAAWPPPAVTEAIRAGDHARAEELFDRAYLDVTRDLARRARTPADPRPPDCGARVRRDRAPRAGGNHRRRGSRRSGTGSRAGPDDPDDPEPSGQLTPRPRGDITGSRP